MGLEATTLAAGGRRGLSFGLGIAALLAILVCGVGNVWMYLADHSYLSLKMVVLVVGLAILLGGAVGGAVGVLLSAVGQRYSVLLASGTGATLVLLVLYGLLGREVGWVWQEAPVLIVSIVALGQIVGVSVALAGPPAAALPEQLSLLTERRRTSG